MATHSRILAWRIPGTEEPRGPEFMGSQRVEHDLITYYHIITLTSGVWYLLSAAAPDLRGGVAPLGRHP